MDVFLRWLRHSVPIENLLDTRFSKNLLLLLLVRKCRWRRGGAEGKRVSYTSRIGYCGEFVTIERLTRGKCAN